MPVETTQIIGGIDMKKTILVTSLMILLAAAPAMSQMMGGQTNPQMMGQSQSQQDNPTGGWQNYQYMSPGMMGGYGYGMGPGMMGYGMGPGMMGGYGHGMMGGYGHGMMGGYGHGMMGGYGHGMHHNMMGGGCYGMGPGMMGGYGYGMGPGMMGFYSPEQYEKQFKENQDFLNETKELRKKMHALKFDYAEALRNPETDKKDLEKLNAEMEKIWKQIYDKKQPRTK
jgi:hypothetical protein